MMAKNYKTGRKITETAAKQAVNQMEFEAGKELGIMKDNGSKANKNKKHKK